MNHFSRIRSSFALLVALLASVLGACGGGGGTSTPAAPTTWPAHFEYRASSSLDPAVDFETCTAKQVVFTVHLHFTWNDWEDRRTMRPVGDDLWTYDDTIPADRDLRVALHDPNNCLTGDVYTAPTRLFLNDVKLTRVEGVTEGTGLGFRIGSDGVVSQ